VAAGQMACLVRQNADDLVRCLGRHQRAGIDENAPAGNEGIEAGVVDQHDVDAGLAEACRAQYRPRVVAHQRLDLGIAHDWHALLGACERNGDVLQHEQAGRDEKRGACGAGHAHADLGHFKNHR
jgi:hypothetical protein